MPQSPLAKHTTLTNKFISMTNFFDRVLWIIKLLRASKSFTAQSTLPHKALYGPLEAQSGARFNECIKCDVIRWVPYLKGGVLVGDYLLHDILFVR